MLLLCAPITAACGSGPTTRTGPMDSAPGTRFPTASDVAASRAPGRLVEVAAGDFTTCARSATGEVACFGANDWKQLGRDSTGKRGEAVRVPEVSAATAIAVGASFACALERGAVLCWGSNQHGSLGVPDRSAERPVPVQGLPDAVTVAAGSHACAIRKGGAVVCWGNFPDFATGYTNDHAAFVAVPGVASARRVAVGRGFACAVLEDGKARCWGDVHELLGVPLVRDGMPVDVPTMARAVDVRAAGRQVCFTRDDHTARCFGAADGASSKAVERAGVVLAVPGATHACALSAAGEVDCWGQNDRGQLGRAGAGATPGSSRVLGAPRATELALGYAHTCALGEDGQLWCWGNDEHGETGARAFGEAAPVLVPGVSGAVELRASDRGACARLGDGSLRCWGDAPPVDVSGVVGFDVASDHGCLVRANHAAACWGAGESGQLGDGKRSSSATPVAVAGLENVAEVRVASGLSCAVLADHTVRCWGQNARGQLGHRRGDVGPVPSPVPALGRVRRLALDMEQACAIGEDEQLRCWGLSQSYGRDCRVGAGDALECKNPPPPEPAIVPGLAGVVDVSIGSYLLAEVLTKTMEHATVSFTPTGGDRGRRVVGPQTVGVVAASDLVALAAGTRHVCALTSGGGVRCRGANERGELGRGTFTQSGEWADVRGLRRVTALAAGDAHTCALDESGAVRCWGDDRSGQVGAQGASNPAVPAPVALPF